MSGAATCMSGNSKYCTMWSSTTSWLPSVVSFVIGRFVSWTFCKLDVFYPWHLFPGCFLSYSSWTFFILDVLYLGHLYPGRFVAWMFCTLDVLNPRRSVTQHFVGVPDWMRQGGRHRDEIFLVGGIESRAESIEWFIEDTTFFPSKLSIFLSLPVCHRTSDRRGRWWG
jgi:hypothetical protein